MMKYMFLIHVLTNKQTQKLEQALLAGGGDPILMQQCGSVSKFRWC
jgi:hypothetical protein